MLLGLLTQVAYCVADNAEVSYTAWHGRRGSGDFATFETRDDSYVIKDSFSMQFSTPALERSGLSQYAVLSGFDGDATKAIFTYTPTKEFPYLYLYFAIEEYVGFSGHVYPYMTIDVYDGASPIGCSFRHEGTEAGIKDNFVFSGQSSLYEFYRPWDIIVYDLSQYVGHALRIEAVATCCSNVKCWTNFYLAFEKDHPRDLCSSCEFATLAAPPMSKPVWKKGNPYGDIYSKSDSIIIPQSEIDNYYCLMTSYCGVMPILMGRALDVHPELSYVTTCKGGKDTLFLYNTSYMQYRFSPYTKFPCDTTLWQFSDGQYSSDPNLPYVVFDEPGLYDVTLRTGSKDFACDSTISFSLPFGEQHYINLVDTICQEDLPYVWRGRNLTISGDYKDTLVALSGCDSVIHLLLTVLDTTISTTSYTICEGEHVIWNGKKYFLQGMYRDTLVNVAGCDSLLTLIIKYKDCSKPEDTTSIPINPMPFLPFTDSIDTIICIGDTIDWHGLRLYSDTIVRDTGYYSFLPLDSVYWVMKVTTKDCSVCDTAYSTTYKQLKASDLPYTWNSQTVPTIPLHPNQDTTLVAPLIKSDLSCDSIATLHLHILFPCELPTITIPYRAK